LLAGEDRGLPVLADSACGFRIVVADAGHSVVVNPFRCAPSSRADSPACVVDESAGKVRCRPGTAKNDSWLHRRVAAINLRPPDRLGSRLHRRELGYRVTTSLGLASPLQTAWLDNGGATAVSTPGFDFTSATNASGRPAPKRH
jgi:hypothetical protein